MADDIIITNSTIQQIENQLINWGKNAYIEYARRETIPIRKSAYQYLNALEIGFKQLQEVFQLQSFSSTIYKDVMAAKTGSAKNYVQLKQKYEYSLKKLEQYMRNIALLTQAFSVQCQRLLGYESEILYIPDATAPIIYKVKSLDDILTGGLTANRINKSASSMRKLANNVNQKVQQINIYTDFGLLQAQYQSGRRSGNR